MLKELRSELKTLEDPVRAQFCLRYFKTGPGQYGEGQKFLGLSAPLLRRLSRKYGALSLPHIRTLLRSQFHEERALALLILVRQFEKGTESHRSKIYNLYLGNTKYINNWDLVDCSAGQIVGGFLANRDRSPLIGLAKSNSIWERRIAMISTFYYIRNNDYSDCFRIAETLLKDREDLIHKASGWMLREIGKRDLAAEEAFLKKHASRMPRTMLRYAIERFPESKRLRYLRIKTSYSR